MTISNNDNRLTFGFGGFAVMLPSGQHLASFNVLGSASVDVTPEFVTTMGGASAGPIASRAARFTGDGTVVLRERPPVLDQYFNEASVVSVGAEADPTIGAITALNGTGINDTNFTVTASADLANYWDIELTATSATLVDVRMSGSGGSMIFAGLAVGSTAIPLGATGVSVAKTTGTMAPGDIGVCAVTPGHNGTYTVGIPHIRTGGTEYQLKMYSAVGGQADALNVYTIPRAVIKGANIALNDVETPGDLELSFTALSPQDGSSNIITRQVITKTA